mmetsp:Transcript_19992/g.45824  ORF Transcript_19992/g.45824 Transcript_19992/m.45824 type:complete len:216 (+) Transcript_19992:693-1340(+)
MNCLVQNHVCDGLRGVAQQSLCQVGGSGSHSFVQQGLVPGLDQSLISFLGCRIVGSKCYVRFARGQPPLDPTALQDVRHYDSVRYLDGGSLRNIQEIGPRGISFGPTRKKRIAQIQTQPLVSEFPQIRNQPQSLLVWRRPLHVEAASQAGRRSSRRLTPSAGCKPSSRGLVKSTVGRTQISALYSSHRAARVSGLCPRCNRRPRSGTIPIRGLVR